MFTYIQIKGQIRPPHLFTTDVYFRIVTYLNNITETTWPANLKVFTLGPLWQHLLTPVPFILILGISWDIHPRLLVFLTFQCFWLIITAADHGIGLILLNPIPLKHLIKKGNCPTVYIIHFFNGKTAPPFHFRLYLTELIYTRRLISSLTGLPICCFCHTWKMATFNCL